MPGLLAGQVKVGSRVGGDGAGAAEPGEQSADTAETGDLCIDNQRLAGTRRAVIMKVKLIGFKDSPGEICWRIVTVVTCPV